MHKKYNTIALLGRDTGVSLLREVLLKNPKINLSHVYTHGKLPKAEGQGLRPELPFFKGECKEHNIPLTILDYPDALTLENYLPHDHLDLLIVLSWKFKVSKLALSRFSIGGINLHRGKLPIYAGLYPVKRAILAGEKNITLTAHEMNDIIDDGEIICETKFKLKDRLYQESEEAYIERMKRNIKPLYNPLANLAIEAMLA